MFPIWSLSMDIQRETARARQVRLNDILRHVAVLVRDVHDRPQSRTSERNRTPFSAHEGDGGAAKVARGDGVLRDDQEEDFAEDIERDTPYRREERRVDGQLRGKVASCGGDTRSLGVESLNFSGKPSRGRSYLLPLKF